MEEGLSEVRTGRVILAIAFALAMALLSRPALAQRPKGTGAPGRQARIEARRERAAANNQKGNKGGQPKNNGNNGGPANATGNRGGNGTSSNGNGGNTANSRNGQNPAPRPPNEQLFKPNSNVVHPNAPQNEATQQGMKNLPGPWVQRLADKSPEEQERFLQNNREFQNLPPERQAQVRRNLQKWNALSPAQKDQMIHSYDRLRQMTPQQRDLYQNQILPKWQQMTPDRRQLINGRLHTLQAMPPDAQQRSLNDPRFMQGLSPDEQGVLRNLVSLRNPNP